MADAIRRAEAAAEARQPEVAELERKGALVERWLLFTQLWRLYEEDEVTRGWTWLLDHGFVLREWVDRRMEIQIAEERATAERTARRGAREASRRQEQRATEA